MQVAIAIVEDVWLTGRRPEDADNELLVIDGEPWAWEFPNGWIDGEYVGQYTLSRINLSAL